MQIVLLGDIFFDQNGIQFFAIGIYTRLKICNLLFHF